MLCSQDVSNICIVKSNPYALSEPLRFLFLCVCVCVCVCRWVKKELCSLYLILYNITNLIYENPLEIYIVAGPYIQLSVRPLPAQ